MTKRDFNLDKEPWQDYRPIADNELRRTSVYVIEVESWSGNKNWEKEAEQSDQWSKLKC